MSIFANIFGSDKIIDGAISGIDKVWFTDEEKAELHLKFLDRYKPFALAQRFLAMVFAIPFVVLGSYGIIFDDTIATKAVELFGTPVSIIVGFYFAGGLLNGIKK